MTTKIPLDAGTVKILRGILEEARQKKLDQAQRLIERGMISAGTEAQHKAAGLAEAARLIYAETIKRGVE